MNIYRLHRTDRIDYDEFAAFVIAAGSPSEAREVAAYSDTGFEPVNCWQTAKLINVGRYTGPRKRPHVILSDFRAG